MASEILQTLRSPILTKRVELYLPDSCVSLHVFSLVTFSSDLSRLTFLSD